MYQGAAVFIKAVFYLSYVVLGWRRGMVDELEILSKL